MRGAGDALDWALALLRAPGQRHALRQRPLPGDVERLLAIASGAKPGLLAEASSATGEREDTLRDAARFYAREVLFHPQADAYRTLGVSRDASQDAIKSHHRLLQHWLHPDRIESDEDAVFAARVNAAWARLRGIEQRAAYDATLPPDAQPSQTRAEPEQAHAHAHAWQAVPEPLPDRDAWPWRQVAIVAIALCLLGVLVVLDADRAPPSFSPPAGSPERDPVVDGDGMTLVLPAAMRGDAAKPSSDARKAPTPVPQARARPTAAAATLPKPAQPAAPVTTKAFATSGDRQVAVAARAERDLARPHVVEQPAASDRAVAELRKVASEGQEEPVVLPSQERVRAARLVGQSLLDYLQDGRRPAPPVWNNPGVASRAATVRERVLRDCGRATGAPSWRIGSERAEISLRQACAGGGRLDVAVAMVWRAQQWLVADIGVKEAE